MRMVSPIRFTSLPNQKDEPISCSNCITLKKELHELRLKNIAIRDGSNKMRAINNLLTDEVAKLQAHNSESVQSSLLNYKQFKDLDQLVLKKKELLKEAKKSISSYKAKEKETAQMLYDTINVKLRYEQIIKNLIENEKNGHEQTTIEIIVGT